MFIKVCGLTRLTDALHAVEQGATAVGFILWPHSSRAVSPDRVAEIVAELPAGVATVGVFVNEPVERIRAIVAQTGLTTVQLHGDETVGYADGLDLPLIRAVSAEGLEGASAEWPTTTTLLVDTIDPVRRGGTGIPVDWTLARNVARRRQVVLAGGLTPETVADAIRAVRPYGVDVSSGVETSPGVKDFDKVARFVERARRAFDAQTGNQQVEGRARGETVK